MVIKAIFFDTSDTLYHNPEFGSAQSGNIITQLSNSKSISYEEAKNLFSKTKKELKSKMDHVTKVAVMMELGINRLQMHKALAEIEPKKYLQPDEKLNKMLKSLGERYELGIITNILDKFMTKILDALGLGKKTFKYIVSVNNTQRSKPHEEPFLKALELCGLQPKECVYVGDSLTKDMVPAKKAGMKTIWVSKESREDKNVDLPVKSIYDVENGILKLEETKE
jgi:HAD superfamily hydrolase (TIGR01549 family)